MNSLTAHLLLVLSLATLHTTVHGEFVTVRDASTRNRTLLCWAIKLSPTAYVTDADCVRSYRKHQIVMIYGDITPAADVRERLDRKVASLRQHPVCQHRVPPLVLVSASSNQSMLDQTVRNFIASYAMLSTARTMTCRECQVLAIRRILPCPATPGTVVLYSNCLKQMDAIETALAVKSQQRRDTWVWELRRKLQATLYADLERQRRQRLEMLNFMTTA
uniref:Uncharacterized protein n=1 Tax=Anopheles culicifacies TaxID=139723 RepID=A0A182MDH4_9DIPT